MKIILASTSVYRKKLLERLGMPFIAPKPLFDEDTYKNKNLSPLELATELSFQKANSLKQLFSQDIIIGSDQVAEIEGTILGKPGNPENHLKQLTLLSGKTHSLWTAVTLLTPNGKIAWVNQTQMTMRSLTENQIKNYVSRKEALDCAGGYKIEAFGISLFEKIQTEDPTAIEGLPLLRLHQELLNLIQK